jgi:hypothetical protein
MEPSNADVSVSKVIALSFFVSLSFLTFFLRIFDSFFSPFSEDFLEDGFLLDA